MNQIVSIVFFSTLCLFCLDAGAEGTFSETYMLAKAIRNGVISADEACRRITKLQSDPPLTPLRYLAFGYGLLAFFTVFVSFFFIVMALLIKSNSVPTFLADR